MATVASYRTLTLPPPLTSFSIYELTNERSCVGYSLRNRECVAAKREDCEDVFLFSAVFFLTWVIRLKAQCTDLRSLLSPSGTSTQLAVLNLCHW